MFSNLVNITIYHDQGIVRLRFADVIDNSTAALGSSLPFLAEIIMPIRSAQAMAQILLNPPEASQGFAMKSGTVQ